MELKLRVKERDSRLMTLHEMMAYNIVREYPESEFKTKVNEYFNSLNITPYNYDNGTEIDGISYLKCSVDKIRDATPEERMAYFYLQAFGDSDIYCDCIESDRYGNCLNKNCIFLNITSCTAQVSHRFLAQKIIKGKEFIVEVVE